MVGLRLAIRVLSVVSQLILVRLLAPEDFGLIGSAAAITGMLDVLSEFSLTYALLQMRTPPRHHYDTAFTLVVLRGLLMGAALWAVAPGMAEFLHDARVADIVRVLAMVPVVQGFESMGIIVLQRELLFGRVFLYRLLGRLFGFLVAIPLAFWLRDYWALVWGGFATRMLTVPLSYAIAPWRPGVSLRAFGELFHFSKWLFGNNVLSMMDGAVMTMVLGRFAGIHAVGLYQVSTDLAAMPASEVAAPIRAPMYAGYARVVDDAPALRAQVLAGLGVLVMAVLPMSVGIAATAGDLAAVALGPQWTDAAPVVAFCALFTLLDAVGHFTGNVYVVRGEQRRYVLIMAAGLAVRLACVIPAALWGGLLPAVAAMTATGLVNVALWFGFMRALIGVSWRDYWSACGRSILAAAAMAAAVAGLAAAWPRAGGPGGQGPMLAMAAHWAALCVAGALVHVAAQAALWRAQGSPEGPERRAAALAAGLWRRLRARLPRPRPHAGRAHVERGRRHGRAARAPGRSIPAWVLRNPRACQTSPSAVAVRMGRRSIEDRRVPGREERGGRDRRVDGPPSRGRLRHAHRARQPLDRPDGGGGRHFAPATTSAG